MLERTDEELDLEVAAERYCQARLTFGDDAASGSGDEEGAGRTGFEGRTRQETGTRARCFISSIIMLRLACIKALIEIY